MDKEAKQLFKMGSDQLKKLEAIVKKSIEEEDLILKNLINPPE